MARLNTVDEWMNLGGKEEKHDDHDVGGQDREGGAKGTWWANVIALNQVYRSMYVGPFIQVPMSYNKISQS